MTETRSAPTVGAKRGSVIDERRGDSPAHPIGVGEKIDEFKEAELGDGGREAGYQVRHHGCDAGPTDPKGSSVERQRLRMAGQGGEVALI